MHKKQVYGNTLTKILHPAKDVNIQFLSFDTICSLIDLPKPSYTYMSSPCVCVCVCSGEM